MRRALILIGLLGLVGCGRGSEPAPGAPPVPQRAKPSPPRVQEAKLGAAAVPSILPPGACAREHYARFFEAFVQNEAARSAFVMPGVDAKTFTVQLRDSVWVDRAAPDVQLDIRPTRSGDVLLVSVVPVERDENDEIVRTLGAPTRYRFHHTAGCWRYAGLD